MVIYESEIKCAYIDLFGVKHYVTDGGDFEETEIVGMQLNLFKQIIDFHSFYSFLERLTGKKQLVFFYLQTSGKMMKCTWENKFNLALVNLVKYKSGL